MARQYKTGLIITGDASGGIKAVRATEKELGQLNQRFEGGSRRARAFAKESGGVSRELQALKRMAAPVGAALAGMFAANSLREQINFADQLQKTNLRIGASTEALSEYAHVASLADVQFSQLTTAWQRQSRRIAQAAQDTGEARDALAALNLDAGELARLAPEEQFERIAEAMSGVAGEAQRVAYAQKIWDSEGVKLLQIVNQGTDAIRAQREEAQRLGLTISQDTAEAMAGFNDEVTRLQAVGTGLSRQILSELVPAMTSGMQATSEWIDEIGGAAQVLDTTKDVATGLAALLAGRYLGAITTSTAAKLAATRQAVLYQAALARMAGASATAAGAQTALAAATRAASGALALIGGPAGAAIIAAGAIYHFREELGLVPTQAETARDRVNDLTGALNENSEAALKNARSMLEAERQLNQFRQAALAMEVVQQRQVVQDEYAQWEAVGGQQAFGMGQRSEAQQALHELEVSLMDARKAAVLAGEGVSEIDEKLADLRDTLSGGGGGGGTTGSVAEQAKAVATQAAETDALAGSLEDLRNRLEPSRRETIQYARDMNTLTLAFAAGRLGVSEYLALQARLAESMATLGSDTADTAQEMSREWERFGNSVDDTFADAFRGAFDSFEDFADQLKGAFENLLAELAYAAVKNEIKIQLGMQGSGPMSGGISNLMGGQGGGLNLGSMKSGWDTVSGWFGGSSGASAGYGGLYSTANTGAAQGGLYGNVATGGVAQSGGRMGGSMQNYQGMNAVYNMGASIAGGYVGGEVGSSVTGKTANSNYGETAGGLIGSYWGPWGAAAGSAIGGFVDSLFGSGEKDYHFDFVQGQQPGVFGDRESALGKFGISRFSDFKRGEQQDQLNDLMTSIAEFDNALASVAIPERVDQMRESIEGFTHSSPDDLFEERLRAIIDGSGAIAEEAILEIADPESLSKAFQGALNLESLGQGLSEELMAGAEHWIEQAAGTESFDAALSSMVDAAAAANVLTQASDRLGIQFDSTASYAIHVASKMQAAAGGVENLAAIHEGYYQAVFSEEEKLSHRVSDFADTLSSVTDSSVSTTDQLRDLVEAQDLSTEAGRNTSLQLMQLAPALAQTSDAVEQAITDAYKSSLGRAPEAEDLSHWMDEVMSGSINLEQALGLIADAAGDTGQTLTDMSEAMRTAAQLERQLLRVQGDTQALRQLEIDQLREIEGWEEAGLVAMQRRIWSLQDAAEAEQEAARQAEKRAREAARQAEKRAREMEQAESRLASFTTGIEDWLAGLRGTDQGMGSPQNQLRAAQSDFAAQLARAESGDRPALQSITQYADRYLAAGQGMYASGSGAQSIRSEIEAALEQLPDALSAEEFLAQEFQSSVSGLATSFDTTIKESLANEIERAISESKYTIDTLISFAATTDQLPDDLRTILGEQAHRLDSTLNYLIGTNELDSDLRTLALKASNNLVSTIDLIAGSDIRASDRRLALESSNLFTSTIDLALGSDLTNQNRRLALQVGNVYSVTTDLILGSDLSAADRTLALTSGHTYATAVEFALRKDISADNRTLALAGGNTYESLVEYAVRKDISAADRKLALTTGNRYTTTLDLILGRNLSVDDRTLALEANNAYASTVDLILGSDISASDRTLALERSHTYSAAVKIALTKDISADSRTLALAGGNTYKSLVEYAVRKDISANDRKLALKSSNRYATQLDYYLRKDVGADDRALALRHNNAYTGTIDLILGKNISADNRKLALKASNTLDATVNASLGKVNAAARLLGLKSANRIQTTIGAVIASNVTTAERKLALQNANRLTTTVNAVLASGVSDDATGLALNASNAISTTINASIAKGVTGNQRKLALGNANRIQTTITASIANGVDAQTRKLALGSGNRIQTTVAGVLATRMSDDVKTLALEQANSFTTTLHASLADGAIDADERKLLDARSEQIVKTLLTDGGLSLTDDERAVIAAASGQKKLELLADVAFGHAELDGLAASIASALEPMFDHIDLNTDGLIDYNEFGRQFAGMATDSQLRRIFNKLDRNGDGQIRKLEAVRKAGAAGAGSIKTVEDFFARAGNPNWGLMVSLSHHQNVAAVRSFGYQTAKQMRQEFGAHGTGIGVSIARNHQPDGLRAVANTFKSIMGPNRVDGSHASGLWNVGFDGYLAELHKDEMVVPAEPAKALRELSSGGAAMPMPASRDLPMPDIAAFPLLGRNDQNDVVRDMQRQIDHQNKEITRLLKAIEQHTGAAVQVQQAGFTRSIDEQRRANRALDEMGSNARLEAAR